jgi:G3E family GTPase
LTEMRVPATIITGFLGSGKTTLLNRLLKSSAGTRLAVIVNEFGAVGVDGSLVQGGEMFVELDNGCLCCALNQDLEQLLRQLMARGGFEHLAIETTGLADPLSVAWTFERQGLHDHYRVDAIVTVVDGANISRALDESEECQIQIEQADIIVLNKIDLLYDGGAAAELEVRKRNRASPLMRAVHSEIPLSLLLETDPGHGRDIRPVPPLHNHSAFESWAFQPDGVVSVRRLEDFVFEIPASVYRVKGLLRSDGPTGWNVVHVVAGRFDISPFEAANASEKSRLVFIGKALEVEGLRRLCLDLAHSVP